jgi:hypothetical protein
MPAMRAGHPVTRYRERGRMTTIDPTALLALRQHVAVNDRTPDAEHVVALNTLMVERDQLRARVQMWEARLPCDGGCQETCSRDGRHVSEVWDMLDEARGEVTALRAEVERLTERIGTLSLMGMQDFGAAEREQDRAEVTALRAALARVTALHKAAPEGNRIVLYCDHCDDLNHGTGPSWPCDTRRAITGEA